MKGLTVYFCLPLLLTSIQASAQASPLRAVIDTNSSQIVESISANQTPSLSVTPGSLLPLTANFSPITQVRAADYRDWSSQIGQQVTVENKHRELSYTGKLLALEPQSDTFSLLIKKKTVTLPINDFYLIPSHAHTTDKSTKTQYPSVVSYQSNDLSWSPKRTLIFTDGFVSLINSAELHNAATHAIQLKNSVLHYSPATPMRAKVEQTALRMSDSSSADYTDNEVTFPLKSAHLKANSDTLVKLIRLQSPIDKNEHTATVYTAFNRAADTPLSFENTLTFTLSADAFPGHYQTFWQRDGLLIPSNNTHLDIARAKQPIQVVTNKSLDITGHLSLVSSTSQKLPSQQTWKVTLQNHSNQAKSYAISHTMRGVISHVEGPNVSQKTASSVQIKGKIPALKTQSFQYQVELKE